MAKIPKESERMIDIPRTPSFFGKNLWMIISIVLVILLIASFAVGNGGASVSKSEVEDKVMAYLQAQVPGEVSITSVEKENGLYKLNILYQGQTIPLYATLDGKNLVSDLIPLSGSTGAAPSKQPTEVPKSDKPLVEVFVMSYCPFGTQMEKGILPVASLLKDKIDFKLRYTHFTLHGEKEDTENFRQICIREEQPSKFLPYIQCTLDSQDPYNPKDPSVCMQQLGINAKSVQSCINGKAKEYYAVDSQLSEGYGVQGSPTLVINGVKSDSGRSPAAVLASICAAFNEQPSECSETLPSDTPSAGFGYNTSGSESAAANCGF